MSEDLPRIRYLKWHYEFYSQFAQVDETFGSCTDEEEKGVEDSAVIESFWNDIVKWNGFFSHTE